jgi:large subunit ribosomal protein L24
MNIKKGDNVIIISGADKGKTGKVAVAFPQKNLILVEGVNVKKRHERRRKENQKGQKVERAMPFIASKAMLVDSSGKRTRVIHKVINGKKVRVASKTGKEI